MNLLQRKSIAWAYLGALAAAHPDVVRSIAQIMRDAVTASPDYPIKPGKPAPENKKARNSKSPKR